MLLPRYLGTPCRVPYKNGVKLREKRVGVDGNANPGEGWARSLPYHDPHNEPIGNTAQTVTLRHEPCHALKQIPPRVPGTLGSRQIFFA